MSKRCCHQAHVRVILNNCASFFFQNVCAETDDCAPLLSFFFLGVVVCLQVQQHELWLNDVIGCTTARFHQVVSEVETRLCVRLETEPVRITGRECRSLAFTLFHSLQLNSLHSRLSPLESQVGSAALSHSLSSPELSSIKTNSIKITGRKGSLHSVTLTLPHLLFYSTLLCQIPSHTQVMLFPLPMFAVVQSHMGLFSFYCYSIAL